MSSSNPSTSSESSDSARDHGLPVRVGSPLWVHAALFALTLLSTTAAGAALVHGGPVMPLNDGLPYSIPLMAILVCHEFGHYIAARVHGVPASLPYFIPLPPFFLFGTMGAVIRMADSPSDRRKLLDVGASGPLAGLVVAIPILIYGLSLSEVQPAVAGSLQEGNSLLYAGLKRVVTGRWLPDGSIDVYLHPTAFAGWVGLFITMVNLLPFGQLDGGHIAVAYLGNRYRALAPRLARILPVISIGVFAWVWRLASQSVDASIDPSLAVFLAVQAALPWVVWFGLLKLLRRLSGGVEHPPVAAGVLGGRRRAVFWLMVLLFVLIFMPVPLRLSMGPADGLQQNVTVPRD